MENTSESLEHSMEIQSPTLHVPCNQSPGNTTMNDISEFSHFSNGIRWSDVSPTLEDFTIEDKESSSKHAPNDMKDQNYTTIHDPPVIIESEKKVFRMNKQVSPDPTYQPSPVGSTERTALRSDETVDDNNNEMALHTKSRFDRALQLYDVKKKELLKKQILQTQNAQKIRLQDTSLDSYYKKYCGDDMVKGTI